MKKFDYTLGGRYELVFEKPLPDIQNHGVYIRHAKTGARVLLFPCEDKNKVFNIAFRTPPKDSTGVAHITEHSVLCGSREFPLKDPFVELAKGSLNTFLNAMTYPDKTMYPVASTNDADFRNLMHVYLDAVFYPNTYREPRIFRQEGWSYEMESPEDALKINGVVYNEMKGVFSSPEECLERVRMNSLFPDSIYGVESGGDPAAIPDLTYEDFLAFHSRYYHPSNSYITLYGNMDMEDTLRFLDEKYLSNFEKIEVDSAIQKQPAFDETRFVRDEYPLAADESPEGRSYLAYSAVCGEIFDKKEMLALKMLDYALLQIPGAPVKQALLDSGICEDVDGGFDDSILQPSFSVIAKNADEENAEKFLSIIRETLTKIAENGIDKKAILAGLNSYEFRFREADFLVFPKGLFYSLDTFSTWLYDDMRPFDALEVLSVYEELRKEVETGYFERLIREKLLDNTFSSMVVLTGKPGLQEEREEEMLRQMSARKAALTPEEIEKIVASTNALREFQRTVDTEEVIRKLPLLTREDLGHEIVRQSNIERRVGDTKLLWHDTKSNGIVYVKLFWDVKKVPLELLPELGLLTSVLLSVSTENYSYNALSSAVDSAAGGMSFSVSEAKKASETGYRPYFCLAFKMFERKVEECFALAKEIVRTSVMSDEKRLREIVASERLGLQTMMQSAGNATAARRAMAGVSAVSAFDEMIQGIEYYRVLKDYYENFEEKKGQLIERLELLMRSVFDPANLLVSVTGEAEGLAAVERALPVLQEGFPENPFAGYPEVEAKPFGKKREAFTTPGQVQYVALAGMFKDPAERFKGSMQILRPILSFGYLWEEIRTTGGAYGCSGYLTRNGGAVLTTYRDPHLARTVRVLEGVPAHIEAFDADEREMTKYIIGTISSIDTPLTPFLFGEFSMSGYFSGLSDEDNLRLREEVLAATPEDIRRAAVFFAEGQENGGLCVVGSEGAIRKNEAMFDHVEALG